MTRKDYELIARVVYNADMGDDVRRMVAIDFADELARTNPAFDRARFLKACGVSS